MIRCVFILFFCVLLVLTNKITMSHSCGKRDVVSTTVHKIPYFTLANLEYMTKLIFLTRLSHTSGMPRFFGSFVFNRKRNVVELELKEDLTGRGSMKYSVSTPRISKIMIREPMY